MAIVSGESNVHDADDPTMSEETMGSAEYSRTLASGPDEAASRKAALTSSTVTSLPRTPTKSVIEPSGTGTRRAVPSSLPSMDWSTRLVARAAPVEAGTILTAAARARRRSLCTRSRRFWSLVYACTVVMRPFSTPKAWSRTLTMGTKQLVVQEALETILWAGGS